MANGDGSNNGNEVNSDDNDDGDNGNNDVDSDGCDSDGDLPCLNLGDRLPPPLKTSPHLGHLGLVYLMIIGL